MSTKRKFTISEVNAMPYDQFIRTFGKVVDNCVFLSASVWSYRPFSSMEDLQDAFCYYMTNLSLAGKESVLRLMSDVTGKSAQGKALSQASTQERATAGLDTLSKYELHTMVELHKRYTNKFGFPFVLCARENKKSAFLTGLETRYHNPEEVEAVVGVREVKKICRLRIADLVEDGTFSTQGAKCQKLQNKTVSKL